MRFPTVYDVLINAANTGPDYIAVYDEHGVLSFRQLEETESLRQLLVQKGIKAGMGMA